MHTMDAYIGEPIIASKIKDDSNPSFESQNYIQYRDKEWEHAKVDDKYQNKQRLKDSVLNSGVTSQNGGDSKQLYSIQGNSLDQNAHEMTIQ